MAEAVNLIKVRESVTFSVSERQINS